MHVIIVWQASKDLTEALLQMSDDEQSKLFYSEEYKLKKVYVGIIVIMAICEIILALPLAWSKIGGYYELIYHISLDSLIVIGLSSYYFSLTKLIETHHEKRYFEIKVSMRYFFLIEIVPLSLTMLHKLDQV